MRELEAQRALEGLSKKEAKRLAAESVRPRSQELAEQVSATLAASGRYAKVEPVNGYINVYFDANAVAIRV